MVRTLDSLLMPWLSVHSAQSRMRTHARTRAPHTHRRVLYEGAKFRATASTNMNAVSSRSHAIFTIYVDRQMADKQGLLFLPVWTPPQIPLDGA